MAGAIERERRRVREVRDERLASTVPPHDEDRDRRLLTARSTERDVEVAVAIVRGAVDVMQAGDERRPDLDEGGLADELVDPDGGGSALESFRHQDRERGRGRGREPRGLRAHAHVRHCRIHREAVTFERDTAPLDRPQRAD